GPHHVAKKSTRTGSGDSTISFRKDVSSSGTTAPSAVAHAPHFACSRSVSVRFFLPHEGQTTISSTTRSARRGGRRELLEAEDLPRLLDGRRRAPDEARHLDD